MYVLTVPHPTAGTYQTVLVSECKPCPALKIRWWWHRVLCRRYHAECPNRRHATKWNTFTDKFGPAPRSFTTSKHVMSVCTLACRPRRLSSRNGPVSCRRDLFRKNVAVVFTAITHKLQDLPNILTYVLRRRWSSVCHSLPSFLVTFKKLNCRSGRRTNDTHKRKRRYLFPSLSLQREQNVQADIPRQPLNTHNHNKNKHNIENGERLRRRRLLKDSYDHNLLEQRTRVKNKNKKMQPSHSMNSVTVGDAGSHRRAAFKRADSTSGTKHQSGEPGARVVATEVAVY